MEQVVMGGNSADWPPNSTCVLLGYVKGLEHLRWIRVSRRYNLRASERRGQVRPESRELAATLVLLYGPPLAKTEIWGVVGNPEVVRRDQMLALGYPNPRGEAYYCLALEEVEAGDWPSRISGRTVEAVRARVAPEAAKGAPVATTWLELVRDIG